MLYYTWPYVVDVGTLILQRGNRHAIRRGCQHTHTIRGKSYVLYVVVVSHTHNIRGNRRALRRGCQYTISSEGTFVLNVVGVSTPLPSEGNFTCQTLWMWGHPNLLVRRQNRFLERRTLFWDWVWAHPWCTGWGVYYIKNPWVFGHPRCTPCKFQGHVQLGFNRAQVTSHVQQGTQPLSYWRFKPSQPQRIMSVVYTVRNWHLPIISSEGLFCFFPTRLNISLILVRS